MSWTPERVKQLINMWNAKAPASEIGAVLHVSRNAVIGKAHRLDLERRYWGSQSRPSSKHKSVNTPNVLRLRESPPKLVITPTPSVKAFCDLADSDCHWPIGQFYCGAIAIRRKPYCSYHMKRSNRSWDDAKRKRNKGSEASGESGSPVAEAAA